MIQTLQTHISSLEDMKKYPHPLYIKGNEKLLHVRKISIVGSRKPNQYAREMTHTLARELAQAGLCIVSGGAMGVDAIAHKAAGAQNTIMVAATGLDKRYPAINKNIIENIEKEGLVISQFAQGTPSHKYNFVLRNELVVALGEILIVTYADKNSGTLRSIEYAQKMGKKIYVLPHRIGESEATNELLATSQAEAIYNISSFVRSLVPSKEAEKNLTPFLELCATQPTYEELVCQFPSEIFEAELQGDIVVKNGRVYLTH
jgi:DNA processing protein